MALFALVKVEGSPKRDRQKVCLNMVRKDQLHALIKVAQNSFQHLDLDGSL